MKRINLFLVLFAAIFCEINSSAQQQAVPFDSKGTIYNLPENLQNKIGLFNGDGRFESAYLFKQSDSTYLLEMQYNKDNRLLREQRTINEPEFMKLRATVDSIEVLTIKNINQEGRGWFLTATNVSGVVYGLSISEALSLKDRSYAACFLLTAGSFFFGPYFLTKNREVTYGQANLTWYGLSRGYAHGIMLTYIVDNKAPFKDAVGVAAITGFTEGVLGFACTKQFKLSDGMANLITIYGDWGLFGGLALAAQLRADHTESILGLGLAGNALGLGLGYQLSKAGDISAGDAEMISSAGKLGLFLPVPILVAINPNDGRYITSSLYLSGIAGLYVGHQLVKDIDFSFSDGFLTGLGTNAGELVGAGIGYIINGNPTVLSSCAAIGGLAGFGTLYYIFKNENKKIAMNNLQFNFNPANALLTSSKKLDMRYAPLLPVFSASWRF